MKTKTMRTMIAAAALVVAAGTASAQTYKAQIPVAFQAAGTQMAAGSYEVRIGRGMSTEIVYVHDVTHNKAIMVVTSAKSDTPKSWRDAGAPRIAFECLGGACTLRRIWDGADSSVYNFPAPKPAPGDVVAHRLEFVTLTMIKAH